MRIESGESRIGRRISGGELGGRHFEVEVEHLLRRRLVGEWIDGRAPGDGVGDLRGENAFSFSGFAEQDAELAFEPEIAEKAAGRAGLCGFGAPAGGGLAAEQLVTKKARFVGPIGFVRLDVAAGTANIDRWLAFADQAFDEVVD